MVVVPKKIVLVREHHVDRYLRWDANITDAEALARDPTAYVLEIDGVEAVRDTHSYETNVEEEIMSFLEGVMYAFRFYHSVMDFPEYTIEERLIRATK
jgi:hypothetical protein